MDKLQADLKAKHTELIRKEEQLIVLKQSHEELLRQKDVETSTQVEEQLQTTKV